MKISNLMLVCVYILMLGGCVAKYAPKVLDPNSKYITFIESNPHNCKYIGQIEGNDVQPINPGILVFGTFEQLKEGAFNDLKNNALTVVGAARRISLRVINEQALCYGSYNRLESCRENRPYIDAYKIKAEVFDCGER